MAKARVDWENWNLNYISDVYGSLLGAGSVKQAAIRTLKQWMPSYVAEINRQLLAPVLTVPSNYLYQPDGRTIAPRTAQMLVTVPSTIGHPERRRDGTRTTFDCRATLFFGGTQDWNESEAIAQAYGAAVMASLGQHPSLGGFAETTLWTGMQIGSEGRSATYYRVNVINRFGIVVSNVMSPFGGPSAPSVSTPEAEPEVLAEHITLERLT